MGREDAFEVDNVDQRVFFYSMVMTQKPSEKMENSECVRTCPT
jgi:hypothetical protein